MSSAAEIVFEHVTKRYAGRDVAAVHDLSLEIPAGTFCVLVGPSGGGKTTAMKMVNRLITITEGDITIDGRGVRGMDLTELRRGIGYVIQQVGLFPHMNVEGNVATVPRLLGWSRQRIRARVGELLELVGLEAKRDARVKTLSGGQQRRLDLALALVGDPDVVFLDEIPKTSVGKFSKKTLRDKFASYQLPS